MPTRREHCRFRSSFGGDIHCSEPAYQFGLCAFHFDCYLRGEILANGQINEKLSDQVRRRAINFHGLPPEQPYAEPPDGSASRYP